MEYELECIHAVLGAPKSPRQQVRSDAGREQRGPVQHRPGDRHATESCLESCPEGAKTEEGSSLFFSWNIGGKPVESAIAATVHSTDQVIDKAIFAFQELPRVQPGWQTTHHDRLTMVQYRGEDQWRGNGVLYPAAEYVCLRRKANDFGVWVRLRRKSSGREFWVCSARLSTGVPDAQTADEMYQVLSLRPPTSLPSIVLADYNTRLAWTGAAGAHGQPLPTTGRADYLFSELERRGYQLHGPGREQWATPTSRPRRRGARGHQIDGVCTHGTKRAQVDIEEGSYRQIGGDHERLKVALLLDSSPLPFRQGETRPRVVAGEIPPQPGLNQARAEQLAVEFTRPKPGQRYRDPSHVKKAFRHARVVGTEGAWKDAQKARQRARDEWTEAKVHRASQRSWKDMKDLKGHAGSEWAVYLTEEACSQGKDPLVWTVQHFADIFRAAAGESAAVEWGRDQTVGRPFEVEELHEVVRKGRTGKAVGLDLTSYELVKALCSNEVSEHKPCWPGWSQFVWARLSQKPGLQRSSHYSRKNRNQSPLLT